MGFVQENISNLGKLRWYEFGLVKLALISLGVLMSKLIPGVLSMEWYWYFAIYIIAVAWPIYKVLKTNNAKN